MPFTFSPLQITLANSVKDVQNDIIATQNTLSRGTADLNPGEQGVVTRLSSQAAGYTKIKANLTVAQNIINVGQTALGSVSDILIQMKALATQSQSAGLVDGTDRVSLNTSFQQLSTQVSALITNASLNGSANNLVSGSSALTVTVNQDGTSPMTLTAQGITSSITTASLATGIDTSTHAGTMITNLDTLIQAISTAQANLSAYTVGVSAQLANATGLESGLNGAVASMTAIDSTALQTKLQSLNNQQSIDYYLVSQLNTASAAILSIFR